MAEKPGTNFDLRLEGKITLTSAEKDETSPKLAAYVFDRGGLPLGDAEADAQGNFSVPVNRTQETDVELFVAPAGQNPRAVRMSSAYSRTFSAKDWQREGNHLRIRADISIPPEIWRPWWPVRVCVSGRIRKVHTVAGVTETCPVSFVKVEVFDVDREGCWWPYLVKWWDRLKYIRILPIEKLLNPPVVGPWPGPGPDPGPEKVQLSSLAFGTAAALNPQPLPPRAGASVDVSVELNPQPEPPLPRAITQSSEVRRAGEAAQLDSASAARVANLTLTSMVPPWIIRPFCFYSKALVCTTYTDCDGNYRCCFNWYPFHFRRGRLRFDALPDIIIKVTQTINGVDNVIYLDPYTSTRWNVWHATIDLDLDNDTIVCGVGCGTTPLPGTSQASVLQIGGDPVFTINQADGMYTVPPVSNAPYGDTINIYGNFSADLKSGAPKRYYKLSYALAGTSTFTPIQTPLTALRSTTLGHFDTYLLGPQPSGPVAGLYEIRDLSHWWLDTSGGPISGSDLLAVWNTAAFEADQNAYTLRMEIFDDAGAKITTIQFPNHGGDGTGVDPAVPPVVTDHLDLKVAIDNRPMNYNLTTPATNACGVIKWTPTLAATLTFHVHADQPHGRVHSWTLEFTKGIDPTRHTLGSGDYNSGSSPVDTDVSGAALFVPPLTSTCAFALILSAYIHVRANWGFIWYGEKIYAIAIEQCQCPPVVA